MFSETDKNAEQAARDRMVEKQLVARGIQDEVVLAVMREIPRHLFLSANRQADAYLDHPAPIDCNQTISQPYMVAIMTAMLVLQPEMRVLEIGTGSGYQTAVLAAIAGEVVSVERHALLADSARQRLEALGYNNITVVVGDGTLGYPEKAPYDAILVTAGAPDIPEVLQQQLAPGGRLVAPVGRTDVQQLVTITREDQETFSSKPGLSCRFVPLIGEYGWRDQR